MEELIKRIARGEEKALRELIRTMQGRVYAYCLSLVACHEDAEELTSEVFYQVWKSAKNFKGRSKATTWLFGIARNLCMNHLRKKKVQFMELMEGDAVYTPEEEEPEYDPEVIKRAMEELSPAHREVLYLAFYEELSYGEIASLLGIPENTVKTRVFHAKKKLKELLEHEKSGKGVF
ncbi:MAG: RNA polymerase sigma factor [Aquificaceae bacterium]|nr:RNA polymerase sigma factor [Aquificaceae bacterium]MDW8031918.1 RNA polymerase sigma factor [Aquificaceae bacterium]